MNPKTFLAVVACMADCVVAAVTTPAAGAAGVQFAQAPTAVADADRGTKISFAVSAPIDVEVALLSGDRVVRHLAAGWLGGEVAAHPLNPGLVQEIVWDGRDDFGAPVAAAECRVRVRLGQRARLGKVLFGAPGLPHDPRAAAVGPDGLVYVLSEHASAKSTFLLQAYTQEGKYVKTIMPYPADLAADRLAGLPRTTLPDGRVLPTIQHAAFRDLYPESTGMRAQRMLITSQGTILLVNASKTHNAGSLLPQRILVVDTDGGTPRPSFLGPWAGGEKFAHGLCWTALSPDEKWLYTAGQRKSNGGDDNYQTAPHEVVYRLDWTAGPGDAPAAPFLGEPYKPGDDQAHFNQPRGLDTDAQGRLYVCDYGNNRVAVFTADGKWAGKLDVPHPDQVQVHRKSGAIYVLTYRPDRDAGKAEHRLLRFAGLEAKTGAASVAVGLPYCVMTLDQSAARPTLWLCRTFGEAAAAKRGVEKIVDLGDTLAGPVEVIGHRPITDPYQIAASMVNDDVFVRGYSDHAIARVNGLTGEIQPLPLKGHDLAVGPDGSLYVLNMVHYFKGLFSVKRFDRDGQPLNLAGRDTHAINEMPGNHWGHNNTAAKGFSVTPRGEVLTIGKVDGEFGLWIIGTDGVVRTNNSVRGLSGADGSPVMDLAGNLYVATAAKAKDQPFPAEFGRPAKDPPGRFYPWMYGSVAKFPPAGGRVYFRDPDRKGPWPPEGAGPMLDLASNLRGMDVRIAGALWCRGGFTITPASNWSVGACACYTSRFAVDYYGRVFMPDNGLFAVRVLDAAGQPLLMFGDYGNEDSAGPGSRVARPAIPLAWPYAVSAGRGGVYVSDFVNRRILRVDFDCAAEAGCAIRR